MYYGELTKNFSELDHHDKVIMENAKDVESYRKSVQRQRVHIFLARLDGDFKQIHGEILRKDPIPELEACYALVHCESVQCATMNGDLEIFEASAMVTQNQSNQNWPPQNQHDQTRPNHPNTIIGADKASYKCTHCHQTSLPKFTSLNLWGIQTGGIIAVIHGRGIPRSRLMLQLLKQGKSMMLWDIS
jgi:hypothetical protein